MSRYIRILINPKYIYKKRSYTIHRENGIKQDKDKSIKTLDTNENWSRISSHDGEKETNTGTLYKRRKQTMNMEELKLKLEQAIEDYEEFMIEANNKRRAMIQKVHRLERKVGITPTVFRMFEIPQEGEVTNTASNITQTTSNQKKPVDQKETTPTPVKPMTLLTPNDFQKQVNQVRKITSLSKIIEEERDYKQALEKPKLREEKNLRPRLSLRPGNRNKQFVDLHRMNLEERKEPRIQIAKPTRHSFFEDANSIRKLTNGEAATVQTTDGADISRLKTRIGVDPTIVRRFFDIGLITMIQVSENAKEIQLLPEGIIRNAQKFLRVTRRKECVLDIMSTIADWNDQNNEYIEPVFYVKIRPSAVLAASNEPKGDLKPELVTELRASAAINILRAISRINLDTKLRAELVSENILMTIGSKEKMEETSVEHVSEFQDLILSNSQRMGGIFTRTLLCAKLNDMDDMNDPPMEHRCLYCIKVYESTSTASASDEEGTSSLTSPVDKKESDKGKDKM